MATKKNHTRTRICLEIVRMLASKFPVVFRSEEIAQITGASLRTAQRAINDLLDSGLIEKHYTGYRFSSALVQQFLGSRWYLKQELDSFNLLRRKHETAKA